MARKGDITESGLLYEGSDFNHWEKTLRRRVRAEGLEHVLGPEPLFRDYSEDERTLVCDIIRLQVSTGLRARILWLPQPQLPPCRLLILLRRLGQPFRLLDLPPELRVRIYSFAIPKDHVIEIAPMRKTLTGYQPIIAASRQLRAEVLPVLYSRASLKLLLLTEFSPGIKMQVIEENERGFKLARGIKACVRHLHAGWLKYLRKVDLLFSFHSRTTYRYRTRSPQWMTLSFSPSAGLQIQSIDKRPEVNLSAESKTRFEEHIQKTEEIRSMLGLQGESLLLALTSDESLWEEGIMYME